MKRNFLFGDEYIKFLQSHISSARPVSGMKEVLCRCFYCPDSRDPSHAHMYISVPQSEDEPSEFHCKKCGTGGYVTTNRLIEWGIYDPIIGTNLDKIMKKSIKSGKINSSDRNIYNIVNAVGDIDLAMKKVQFINDRLGTNFSLMDCINLKIVLNLKDLILYNQSRIPKLTRHENIIQQLNDNFVGFLSEDNNFVNLRRMCDEGIVYESIDKRYVNYNIFGKRDNTEKMYILPTMVDVSIPGLKIHIAEGPFDILSVYRLRNMEHGIYCAIGGSGYAPVLDFIINRLKIYNYPEIHFYPDNDSIGTNQRMVNIRNYYKPYGMKFFVHRNMYPGQKDMGVHISKIQEGVNIL